VSLCHPYTGPSSALSPPEGPETAYLPIVSPRPTACATVRLSLRPSVAAAGPSFLSFSLREAKAVAITPFRLFCRAPCIRMWPLGEGGRRIRAEGFAPAVRIRYYFGKAALGPDLFRWI
jgi:hypothetical protein